MKKLSVILIMLALGMVLMFSCHGSKKCPAYSKATTEQANTNS